MCARRWEARVGESGRCACGSRCVSKRLKILPLAWKCVMPSAAKSNCSLRKKMRLPFIRVSPCSPFFFIFHSPGVPLYGSVFPLVVPSRVMRSRYALRISSRCNPLSPPTYRPNTSFIKSLPIFQGYFGWLCAYVCYHG